MANTPPTSDQTLLERLNALKPTNVTLDKEKEPTIPSSLIPTDTAQSGGPPLSKDDALSARLRTLRNQPGREPAASASPQSSDPSAGETSQGAGAAGPATPADLDNQEDHVKRVLSPSSSSSAAGTGADEVDFDSLFLSSNAATALLDELILENTLAGEGDSGWEFDEAAFKRRAAAVAKFEKDAKANSLYESSEDEETRREVEDTISQAREEAELAKGAEGGRGSPEPDWVAISADAAKAGPDGEDKPANVNEADFSLPSVPSALVDPEPSVDDEPDEPGDFENDIAARMAALRGLGFKSTAGAGDSFGLPSAPTFQPEDRPVPGVAKKVGYTDDDQKTWCIVCLEDGTIRCIGCDDDVYCARCWKDMHVGPAAGYEERGHKWVKFHRN